MIVAKTAVGGNEIFIEAVEESIQVAGEAGGRQTQVTGIEDHLKDAYSRVKDVISSVAGDFADSLRAKAVPGQKVEIEFNLGLSATSGFWILSSKGECTIKVKMTWEAPKQ